MKHEITLIEEKETKGTVRYTEVLPSTGKAPDNPVIGTLYIKKPALDNRRPKGIKVTIEFNDE